MTEQIDIESVFREIVSHFESAGITDSVLIAEHVAFFMLCWHGGTWKSLISEVLGTAHEMSGDSYVSNLQDMLPKQLFKPNAWQASSIYGTDPRSLEPSAPTGMQAGQLATLINLFNNLFENITDLGEWFDQIALPRLFKTMQGGGRYPTPRHIEGFMAHLVQVNEKDSIADFACGTGGMLVAAGRVARATGVEISPNMARLALTNLILHGQEQHNLYLGNTFYLAGYDHAFREARYDVILMNPPFGISLDPALVDATFAEYVTKTKQITGRSETLFAYLACEKLKPGGRMAVMVPSGVLFSNSGGESILRDILLEDVALKAVISLPKDSSQPYSALPTHVLVAQKPQKLPKEYNDIWFYQARYDGYTSGRNRQPDSQHNDLPIIGTAVVNHQKAKRKHAENAAEILAQPLIDNKEIIGYEFKGNGDLAFHVTRLNSDRDSGQICFLAETGLAGIQNAVLVYQKDVYRSTDKEDITLGLPEEVNVKSDLSFTFSDKSHQGLHLKIWSDAITLWRKDISIDYQHTVPTKEFTSLAFVIDDQGKLISPGEFIDSTCLKKREYAYTLSLESQNEPMFARLIIFPDYIHARMLVSQRGKEAYWFQIDDGWGVFIKSRGVFILGHVEQCFESDNQRSGVLFDSHGDLIGVAVPAESVLNSKERDLQPVTYLPVKKIEQQLRIPAQMLADIKINQNELSAHLDRLMGIAELKAITKDILPQDVTILNPPIELQGVQIVVWNGIQSQVEAIGSLVASVPFQAGDIAKIIESAYPVEDIQRNLELFERMGLIVKVSYKDIPFYRLLTKGDVEKGEEG